MACFKIIVELMGDMGQFACGFILCFKVLQVSVKQERSLCLDLAWQTRV